MNMNSQSLFAQHLKPIMVARHFYNLGSGEFQPQSLSNGICNEIGQMFFSDVLPMDKVNSIVKSWKYFSGDIVYPISNLELSQLDQKCRERAAKSFCSSAFIMYHDAKDEGNLWSGSKNAERRRELCLHIADSLISDFVKSISESWIKKFPEHTRPINDFLSGVNRFCIWTVTAEEGNVAKIFSEFLQFNELENF